MKLKIKEELHLCHWKRSLTQSMTWLADVLTTQTTLLLLASASSLHVSQRQKSNHKIHAEKWKSFQIHFI